MIIPVYKPLGASTHLLAKKVGALHDTKATHTGTLDPLAEGVVVVLTAADRFNKTKLSNWEKTYQFQITFGISTDSHDLLGEITQMVDQVPSQSNLTKRVNHWLENKQGISVQTVPAFSARRLAGTSSFALAKNKATIPSKQEKIVLHHAVIEETSLTNLDTLSNQAMAAIKTVTGNFRQQILLTQWQQLQNDFRHLPTITITATTSKRTYIRGLVRDIAANLTIPAVTSQLIRTANGPYSIKDCVCLV